MPYTVFPNVCHRFPICSICPYIWFQNGLPCAWADWILHIFLNCAFLELWFNYVHGIRALSSLHEHNFELQSSNLGGIVEREFSVHLVLSYWKYHEGLRWPSSREQLFSLIPAKTCSPFPPSYHINDSSLSFQFHQEAWCKTSTSYLHFQKLPAQGGF